MANVKLFSNHKSLQFMENTTCELLQKTAQKFLARLFPFYYKTSLNDMQAFFCGSHMNQFVTTSTKTRFNRKSMLYTIVQCFFFICALIKWFRNILAGFVLYFFFVRARQLGIIGVVSQSLWVNLHAPVNRVRILLVFLAFVL